MASSPPSCLCVSVSTSTTSAVEPFSFNRRPVVSPKNSSALADRWKRKSSTLFGTNLRRRLKARRYERAQIAETSLRILINQTSQADIEIVIQSNQPELNQSEFHIKMAPTHRPRVREFGMHSDSQIAWIRNGSYWHPFFFALGIENENHEPSSSNPLPNDSRS